MTIVLSQELCLLQLLCSLLRLSVLLFGTPLGSFNAFPGVNFTIQPFMYSCRGSSPGPWQPGLSIISYNLLYLIYISFRSIPAPHIHYPFPETPFPHHLYLSSVQHPRHKPAPVSAYLSLKHTIQFPVLAEKVISIYNVCLLRSVALRGRILRIV